MGGNDHSVPQLAVSGNAHLTGQNHIAAQLGGAGHAHLGTEHGVFADSTVMSHLNQVIDFGSAPDAALAQAGAVNAGVGLDLDIIFDYNFAGLGNFLPAAILVLAGVAIIKI